jgi:hypothetical protein
VTLRIETPGDAVYPVLTSVADTVYFAFIGAANIPHHDDNNSVWIKRSLDGGKTWEKDSLISLSGDEPAHQVQLHITPDSHLHLLWQQHRTKASMVIRHVESADGGRTWSAPDDLQPSAAQFANLNSVVDPCGRLHVLHEYLGFNADHMKIEYATWQHGWSPVERLFPDVGVVRTTLQRAPDGRLRLVTMSEPTEVPVRAPRAVQFAEKVLDPRR